MTTDPRQRGRPPKAQTRTAEVHLRLTPAELAAIDQARGDQDRNAWIREAIKNRLQTT